MFRYFFRRKRKKMEKPEDPVMPENPVIESYWNVFNSGTDLEFVECARCGQELVTDGIPLEFFIEMACPRCWARMKGVEIIP